MDCDSGDRERTAVRLIGAPSYLYKQAVKNLFGWANAWIRRRESDAFYFESQTRDLLSYVRETYKLSCRDAGYSRLAEIALFAQRLVQKKIKGYKN